MTNHFQTWQATRKRCENLPEHLCMDEDTVSATGYVYDGGYIEDRGDVVDGEGRFFLLIERSDWIVDTLEHAEEILWSQWAIYEGSHNGGPISGDDLDVFVRGTCRAHGIECDGDLWGLLFSSLQEYTPHEANQIMIDTIYAPIQWPQPKAATAAPVGTPFGV